MQTAKPAECKLQNPQDANCKTAECKLQNLFGLFWLALRLKENETVQH